LGTNHEKSELDRQIKVITDKANIGEKKKGDLRGLSVQKLELKEMQYLLAYRLVGEDLELVMIGPHKNYYRDLKQYLKTDN
jgi:mRNA interferase RelE/StbE